jgi:glycerol-3-phosphate O-acyltransferase/dihydroxyacetone phosphate acyltransferase
MLYASLKFLIRIALRVFFRRVYVRNRSLIPLQGPMIVCANHPATFLDPLVIGASLKPELFFLSKGEVFKGRLAKWLLPRLNMIPVYRQQDNPAEMHKNEDTFNRCFEHLERGGVILIFPEGVSLTERKLRKIKTGTARIALGAEARNGFGLGVKIVNIGLNYTNPHKFNQDLFMNVDTPIEVSTFREVYENDPIKAAALLTEEIRQSLEKHIIAIEDEQTDKLVHRIEIIYKQRLANDMGRDTRLHADDFTLTRGIVDTVEYFKQKDPAKVEALRLKTETYFDDLKRAGLSDRQLNPEGRKARLLYNNMIALLFMLLGFPFYLFGLITNFLAFEIPGWFSKRYAPAPDFVGPFALVSGMLSFIFFYTLQIFLFRHFIHSARFILLFALSMPVSGAFCYFYWYVVKDIRSRWLLMSLFYRKTALVSGLISNRKEITDAFDQARDKYRVETGIIKP